MELQRNLSFRISEREGKEGRPPEIVAELDQGDHIMTQSGEEIAEEILKYLRELTVSKINDGETPQDDPFSVVVVTHPARFLESQMKATLNAAIRAGFPKYRTYLFSEPEAAALKFCEKWSGKSGPILVCDLGGSTTDYAIVYVCFEVALSIKT